MRFLRLPVSLALTLLVAGCAPRSNPESKLGAKSETTNVAANGTKKEANPENAKADDVLISAIYQLRPENYGIHSNPDKPVSLLNSWRAKRAEQASATEQTVATKTPEGWVLPEEVERLNQLKFDGMDSVHVRDSLFFHAVAGYLADRGREELQIVGIVVDFVCRNVSLWKDDELELPISPFMSLQLGRGTPQDRAWVCASILRQLRSECVILQAKADSKVSDGKWLLGVPFHQKTYLFDLHLGLPVSSGSANPSEKVASLDQVIEHPEILDQMSASGPYRLSSDDLKAAEVQVMSELNFWCQRMHTLEQDLPATDICILFQPLIGDDSRPGLLQTISTKGGWPVESLKLWPVPHQQMEASHKISPAAGQQFQQITAPFSVPIPFTMGSDGKKVEYGNPERRLERFRLEHLLGKFSESTQRYLSIRHLEVERNPAELDRLNRVAAENSFYWTAVCKVEMDDNAGAMELFQSYLKKYDRKGMWYYSVRSQLAKCQANAGQLSEAIKTLERSSSDDPYQAQNALLVKRWTAAVSK